jgi:hypothetical protein
MFSLSQLLNSLKRASKTPRRRPHVFVPRLEPLEDRTALTVSYAQGLFEVVGGVGLGWSGSYQVAAGQDRLLVLDTAINGATVTNVTFGSTPLTKVVSRNSQGNEADLWVLPLGGGSAFTANFVMSTNRTGEGVGFISGQIFSGVNKNNPIDATNQEDVPQGATAFNLSVASAPGDMVQDVVAMSSNTGFISLQSGPGQTFDGGGGGGIGQFEGEGYASYKAGAAPNQTMDWNVSGPSGPVAGAYVAVNLHSATYMPTVTVHDGGTYDGTAHNATGSAVGVDGTTPVAGTFTYTYYTVTNGQINLNSATSSAPIQPGSYGVVAHFHSSDPTYENADSPLQFFNLGKAQANISISGASGNYDGTGHASTVTASGVESPTPANLTSELHLYYFNGTSFDTSAPVNAGTYGVYYTFDGDNNYQAISNLTYSGKTVTIGQAQANISITGASVTYDGTGHAATGTASGVESAPVNLTSELHLYYSSDGGSTFSTSAPIDAGAYEVYYSFDGDNNYQAVSTKTDSGKAVIVGQAQAIISITGAGVTYDGTGHAATGTASGVESPTPANLTSELHLYYSSDGGNTFSASAPVNAGIYEVYYTFDGDNNYQAISTKTDSGKTASIAKATTALSNLTVQQIALGTSSTSVSGHLTSNTIIPVGQSVSITLDGVTQSATVGPDGSFSVNFATSGLGAGAYPISYSYGGDNNFTAATGTGSLTVAYSTQLLFNNSKPVHSGADLPIKLELTDGSGADISSANIAVTAVSLMDSKGDSVSLRSAGNANPNDPFHYDPNLGGYIFNLDTKGLAAGTYTFYYKAGNDPTLHSLTFVVD